MFAVSAATDSAVLGLPDAEPLSAHPEAAEVLVGTAIAPIAVAMIETKPIWMVLILNALLRGAGGELHALHAVSCVVKGVHSTRREASS
jgi:hypothetical protein